MRKLAIGLAVVLTAGVLLGVPAAAAPDSYGAIVQLPSNSAYSPAGGPVTVTFTFDPGESSAVFTVRIFRLGHPIVKQKNFLVDPATDTSPHDVSFSWSDISVATSTNYTIDVRRQGDSTARDIAVLTVLPTLVSKVSASPATFYPLVDDGYRDKTDISFSLAADTTDATLHIYRADTYGRCCGTEVQTVPFGPLGHGNHSWSWDGIKSDLSPAGKGTYFARIDATDTGAVSMTSKALKVMVAHGTIRRSATKTKNGALYARVGSARPTASGGNCAVWRSPPNAGVLCANAEVTLYYRWGLKPNERVKSVSFKVEHGYYLCTHKLGHTAAESFIKVHSPPRASCTIVSATIVYTYPYQA